MSDAAIHGKLRFGPFELSVGARVLRRDGAVLPLGSRALDILIYLSGHPGEVISKQKLLDHVWSDVNVEEGSLRVHVAAIRKALGDGKFGNRYIANIQGRGYSFVGTVAGVDNDAADTAPRRYHGPLPARPRRMVGREQMLTEVIDHVREDVDKVSEPKAQVLFETTAEVLIGLRTAYEHYETGSEKAMRQAA